MEHTMKNTLGIALILVTLFAASGCEQKQTAATGLTMAEARVKCHEIDAEYRKTGNVPTDFFNNPSLQAQCEFVAHEDSRGGGHKFGTNNNTSWLP